MNNRHFWTATKIARLKELAQAGIVAADIGADIGTTQLSVLTFAGRYKIPIVKYSPEQQQIYDDRARQREVSRNIKSRAATKAKLIASRKAAMAQGACLKSEPNAAIPVQTLRRIHAIPEMSKSEQRAFLASAVRNTAQMQVGEA